MAEYSLRENALKMADFIRRTGVEIKAKGVSLYGVVPIDYPEKIREITGGGTGGGLSFVEIIETAEPVKTITAIDYTAVIETAEPIGTVTAIQYVEVKAYEV